MRSHCDSHPQSQNFAKNSTIYLFLNIDYRSRYEVFFVGVTREYGYRVRNEMRTLLRLHQSLASLVNKKIFLLNCKNNEVVPKSLNYNFGYVGKRFHKIGFEKIRKSFLKSLLTLGHF